VWLKAFEAGYHDRLLGQLQARTNEASRPAPARPYSQSVYCIDVRSEPFRRHLESVGPHDTYGFAGFFAAFIRYRAWGKEHDTEQFPVIMHVRNEVREIPRSYLDEKVSKHAARTKWVRAGHTLLHDLKENVVTPYVMVESLGLFYGFPIFGKTLLPSLYQRWTAWLRRLFVPQVATTLTVDKLAPSETAEMLAAEQQAIVAKALQERTGLRSSRITPTLVEAMRQRAFSGQGDPEPPLVEEAERAGLSKEALDNFVVILRRQYDLNARAASRHKERITRTGFTLEEQTFPVDTALRMMGLTALPGSSVLRTAASENNASRPWTAGLRRRRKQAQCPRLAMMANNQKVRERRSIRIEIPPDTHFLAGQMDTTTDDSAVRLEDVPPTHRADLSCCKRASTNRPNSRSDAGRFPGATGLRDRRRKRVQRRSVDWSQWVDGDCQAIRRSSSAGGSHQGARSGGASSCIRITIAKTPATPARSSVDRPQVVAQWINMEHYFSTVTTRCTAAGVSLP
jgi:uncharacterized protein YbcC (UPF0753/DUF2309 family)